MTLMLYTHLERNGLKKSVERSITLGVALRSKLLSPSSDKPLHLHRRRTRHITPPDNSPQHAVAAQQP